MKKSTLITALLLTGLVLFGWTIPSSAKEDDEAAIRALEKRFAAAVQARDFDQIMSCYVPGQELFVFDVIPPRQYVGAKAYRENWKSGLNGMSGPIKFEVSDLTIVTDGKLAYSHSVQRYISKGKDGKPMDFTVRVTDVYRKIKGKWLIVQEHASVPVDTSGKPDFSSKL